MEECGDIDIDRDAMQRLLHEIHDCPAFLNREVDYFTVNWEFWVVLTEQYNDGGRIFMSVETDAHQHPVIVIAGCKVYLNKNQKQEYTTYLK